MAIPLRGVIVRAVSFPTGGAYAIKLLKAVICPHPKLTTFTGFYNGVYIIACQIGVGGAKNRPSIGVVAVKFSNAAVG